MLSYHDILAAVAVRVNALGNVDLPEWNPTSPAGLQVVYQQRPLIDEMFGSSIFPMNAMRDAIIETEGKIAQTVGLSGNHVLRAYIKSQTAPLASGVDLPNADALAAPIIGNFGAVFDGSDQTKMLTRKPVAYVQNILNAPGIYLVPLYHYALDANRILHTRDTAILECCSYSASTQTAAFDAMEAILFPDALAEAYINGALAILVRDDEFLAQSGRYAEFFTTTLASLPTMMMEQQAI